MARSTVTENEIAPASAQVTSKQIDTACALIDQVAILAMNLRDLLVQNEETDGPLSMGARALAEKAGYLSERAIEVLGRKAQFAGADYDTWAVEARFLSEEAGEETESEVQHA